MLTHGSVLAADSIAYQAGGFFGQIALFVIGICLIMSGVGERRSDSRKDGVVKISIGAALLLVLVVSLFVGIG